MNPFMSHFHTYFSSYVGLYSYHEVEVSPGCGMPSAIGSPYILGHTIMYTYGAQA